MSGQPLNTVGIAALLNPAAVALVGASASGVGRRLLDTIINHGYTGTLYPINPKHSEVQGVKCYGSLSELPQAPDLAVIAVQAAHVQRAVAEAAAVGTPAAVVLSSGFGETGSEGQEREEQLKALARTTGIRILGPNSIGLINPRISLAATFSSAARVPSIPAGRAAFVSQSGSMAGSFLNRAVDYGLGISAIVSTGNEADVQVTDVVAQLLEDPDIAVIGLFLEGVRNGAALMAVGQRAAQLGKPLVVLKGARSKLGRRVAASHTGAVAGEDRVYTGVFRHLGMVQVDELEDLLPTMAALEGWANRLPAGRSVGIISASGGAAVLATDAAVNRGLELPPFSAATREALTPVLPDFASLANPIDVTAQLTTNNPAALETCVATVAADPVIDYVAVVLSMRSGAEDGTVTGTLQAAALVDRPVLVTSVAGSLGDSGMALLRSGGVPTFRDPARAMVCIARLATYKADRERLLQRTHPAAISFDLPERTGLLDEAMSKSLLRSAGIPVVAERTASGPEAAVAVAVALGFPVVLKALHPNLAHKTEVGAVLLDLRDADEVKRGWALLAERLHSAGLTLAQALVQPMIRPVAEALVGVSYAPEFGPMISVGAGGIFVELLDDVAVRPAPVSAADAEEMLAGLRFCRMLEGARGRPRGDKAALVDLVVKVSALAASAGPAIREIDLNPVAVMAEGHGVLALDGLILLAGGEPGGVRVEH